MSKDTGLSPRVIVSDNFPNWEKPKPLSCFSVNDERFYESSCKNMRYLKLPQKLPIDLDIGVEYAKKKPETDEALDHLLEHIMNSYPELTTAIGKNIFDEPPQQQQKCPLYPMEFVSWRGLLRLIMCTPFEYRNNWIINVTRFKGTHYLCERETQDARETRRKELPYQKRMCSWGRKFEQYCLATSPEVEPETDEPVDECSEFACIFHTRLEGINLLYGAEMDGIKSERPVDINRELQSGNVEFIELKTGIRHMNDKHLHNFQCYKTRNWWCQSFLVGIDSIFVGWRDEEGMVKSIEELKVNQLPKQSKNWTPNQCAQFLVAFLNCVKNIMSSVDCPYTVYEFRYDAKNSLITYDVFKGLTSKTILPDYYIHFMERLTKPKT